RGAIDRYLIICLFFCLKLNIIIKNVDSFIFICYYYFCKYYLKIIYKGENMIFSILTFITLYLSVCIKNRKGSLTAQSISCILESIYDFTINATTGAVTNFINFIRTIL